LQRLVENDFRGFAVKIRFAAAPDPVVRCMTPEPMGSAAATNQACAVSAYFNYHRYFLW
jgi:hypothetical protein